MGNTSAVFIKDYKVEKMLGEGGFGTVVQASKPGSNEKVAIKMISKDSALNSADKKKDQDPEANLLAICQGIYLRKAIEREVECLKSMNHPNLPRFIDAFQTDKYYVIVQNLIEGIDLSHFTKQQREERFKKFDVLNNLISDISYALSKQGEIKGVGHEKDTYKPFLALNENGIKTIFVQLINAVRYLHSINMCHRDIKPDNIRITLDEEDNLKVVLIDLGIANRFDKTEENLYTNCGTPFYIPPEVMAMPSAMAMLNNGLDTKPYSGDAADIWLCGIVLYEMFMGEPPFTFIPSDKFFQWSKFQDLRFTDGMDSDAVDLIKKMLEPFPRNRCKMEDIINHPWLRDQTSLLQTPVPAEELPPLVPAGLEYYTGEINIDGIEKTTSNFTVKDYKLFQILKSHFITFGFPDLPKKNRSPKGRSSFIKNIKAICDEANNSIIKSPVDAQTQEEDVKHKYLQPQEISVDKLSFSEPFRCANENVHNQVNGPTPLRDRRSKSKSQNPVPKDIKPEVIPQNGAGIDQVPGANEEITLSERYRINLARAQALAANCERPGNLSSKRVEVSEGDFDYVVNGQPANSSQDVNSDNQEPTNNTTASLNDVFVAIQAKLHKMGVLTSTIGEYKLNCMLPHRNSKSNMSLYKRLQKAWAVIMSGERDFGKEARFEVELKHPDSPTRRCLDFKRTKGHKKVFKAIVKEFALSMKVSRSG